MKEKILRHNSRMPKKTKTQIEFLQFYIYLKFPANNSRYSSSFCFNNIFKLKILHYEPTKKNLLWKERILRKLKKYYLLEMLPLLTELNNTKKFEENYLLKIFKQWVMFFVLHWNRVIKLTYQQFSNSRTFSVYFVYAPLLNIEGNFENNIFRTLSKMIS